MRAHQEPEVDLHLWQSQFTVKREEYRILVFRGIAILEGTVFRLLMNLIRLIFLQVTKHSAVFNLSREILFNKKSKNFLSVI